jgi:hypothetical protein
MSINLSKQTQIFLENKSKLYYVSIYPHHSISGKIQMLNGLLIGYKIGNEITRHRVIAYYI